MLSLTMSDSITNDLYNFDMKKQEVEDLKIKKVGYTATLVACGWAGAVLEKVTRVLGRSSLLRKLKNAKKVIVAKALDGQRYLCPA